MARRWGRGPEGTRGGSQPCRCSGARGHRSGTTRGDERHGYAHGSGRGHGSNPRSDRPDPAGSTDARAHQRARPRTGSDVGHRKPAGRALGAAHGRDRTPMRSEFPPQAGRTCTLSGSVSSCNPDALRVSTEHQPPDLPSREDPREVIVLYIEHRRDVDRPRWTPGRCSIPLSRKGPHGRRDRRDRLPPLLISSPVARSAGLGRAAVATPA